MGLDKHAKGVTKRGGGGILSYVWNILSQNNISLRLKEKVYSHTWICSSTKIMYPSQLAEESTMKCKKLNS